MSKKITTATELQDMLAGRPKGFRKILKALTGKLAHPSGRSEG